MASSDGAGEGSAIQTGSVTRDMAIFNNTPSKPHSMTWQGLRRGTDARINDCVRSRSSRKAREFRADLGVDSWRQRRTDMTGFRYRSFIAVNFVQGRMGA